MLEKPQRLDSCATYLKHLEGTALNIMPPTMTQTMSSPVPHDPLISQSEPDADTIKMFVGQIPRHYDEDDLRKMFSKYGPVYSVTVLRDKQKGQSKGCCFVTFYKRQASLDAQNDLHNLKTMPGMSHPIQMKPADSEKRNVEERKLFVGMISKKWTENDVRALFATFGSIEECTILRENNESKGCAFVTFANKQSAQNAIKSVHHSQTMEGCRSPVVVKIADTQKDKEMRKVQQINNNIFSAAQMPFGALCPQYLAYSSQLRANPYAAPAPLITNPADPQLLQQAIGTGNLGALGALGLNNSLGLQQLLTSASTQGNNASLLASLLANLLSGLANQNSSSGQAAGGATSQQANSAVCPPVSASGLASPPPSTDSSLYSHCDPGSMQQLQGLALLASMAGSPGGMYDAQTNMNAMNAQNLGNLQLLNQLSNSSSSTNPLSGLGNTASLLGKSGLFNDHHEPNHRPRLPPSGSPIISLSDMMTPTSSSANLTGSSLSMSNSSVGSLNGFSSGLGSNSPNPTGMEALYTGLQQYAASFPGSMSALQQQKLMAGADQAAGKQTEGPDGANLFIYHLPQEFTDQDLMQTFVPFGNVISSKVFIDKQTKLSKCFGFVSYDNPLSANAAIQNMNGFQIGTKRLKVQLKRPKSDAKPY